MRKLAKTIIAIVLFSARATAGETVGAWAVSHDRQDGYYAATVNDSGNLIGQFCFPKEGSCVWLLGLDTSCEKGYRSPVLANYDRGSAALEVYCDGRLDSGLYRYAFTDFDAVDQIVRQGQRVGFALPLEGDKFSVERFNLNGSVRAIEDMRQEAASATAGPTGTRKEML